MVTDAPLLTNPYAPPAFHLLAKPTGAICKLAHAYAVSDAERGRNEPCTCGSGLEWTRCHGAG
jgi:uncharacterized protein